MVYAKPEIQVYSYYFRHFFLRDQNLNLTLFTSPMNTVRTKTNYFYLSLFNSYFSILKAYSDLVFPLCQIEQLTDLWKVYSPSRYFETWCFLVSALTTAWYLVTSFWNLVLFWYQIGKLPDIWWVSSWSRLVRHFWCQLWYFLCRLEHCASGKFSFGFLARFQVPPHLADYFYGGFAFGAAMKQVSC